MRVTHKEICCDSDVRTSAYHERLCQWSELDLMTIAFDPALTQLVGTVEDDVPGISLVTWELRPYDWCSFDETP